MQGILIVDKPAKWTSHDVVQLVRRKLHLKKVGHAGTLDPLATGVLVLLLGRATKLSQKFSNQDKVYEVEVMLGVSTATGDAEGKVRKTGSNLSLSVKQIKQAVLSYRGEIEQIPPMFSALRYRGQRLYSLARKGVEIKRIPRKVIIYEINRLKIEFPKVSFTVHCSKGTYIRALVEAIGKKLDCGGYVLALRRIKSGPFSIGDAFSAEQIKRMPPEDIIKRVVLS
jgi:tRNA pseudouridine55 synthase